MYPKQRLRCLTKSSNSKLCDGCTFSTTQKTIKFGSVWCVIVWWPKLDSVVQFCREALHNIKMLFMMVLTLFLCEFLRAHTSSKNEMELISVGFFSTEFRTSRDEQSCLIFISNWFIFSLSNKSTRKSCNFYFRLKTSCLWLGMECLQDEVPVEFQNQT